MISSTNNFQKNAAIPGVLANRKSFYFALFLLSFCLCQLIHLDQNWFSSIELWLNSLVTNTWLTPYWRFPFTLHTFIPPFVTVGRRGVGLHVARDTKRSINGKGCQHGGNVVKRKWKMGMGINIISNIMWLT